MTEAGRQSGWPLAAGCRPAWAQADAGQQWERVVVMSASVRGTRMTVSLLAQWQLDRREGPVSQARTTVFFCVLCRIPYFPAAKAAKTAKAARALPILFALAVGRAS